MIATTARTAYALRVLETLVHYLGACPLPRSHGERVVLVADVADLVRGVPAAVLVEALGIARGRLAEGHAFATGRVQWSPMALVQHAHALAVLDGERPGGFSRERADREEAASLQRAREGVATYRA